MPEYLTQKLNKISAIIENDRRLFLVFCAVLAMLIVDDMFHYVSDLIIPVLISPPSIALFTVIVFASSFGLYIIVEYVKLRSKEIREKDQHMRIVHNIVIVSQYVLIAIAVFITLEILFTFQYYTIILVITTLLVTSVGVGVLSMFAYKLFRWFKSNRSSVVVLLYGLSFGITTFTTALINFRDAYLLSIKPPIVNSGSPVIFPTAYLEPGSLMDNLYLIYDYVDYVGFGLLILATGILLRHYSQRVGKLKFWVLITLPLAYQVSTVLEVAGLYTPVTDADWFYWWLYSSLNATAGGILFAVAFMTIAKTLRADSSVKHYMKVTAYGFVLLFVSTQVTLVGSSYPPVGLVTFLVFPLSSYMVFLGLYSTAVSISQDNQLRKSIKKFARENSDLLGSIGTAHMEQEIQRTVNSMKEMVLEQEKELEEQTGIETNLEEDEMKKYLEQVMQEVGKTTQK